MFVPSLFPTVSTLCTDPDLVQKMKKMLVVRPLLLSTISEFGTEPDISEEIRPYLRLAELDPD